MGREGCGGAGRRALFLERLAELEVGGDAYRGARGMSVLADEDEVRRAAVVVRPHTVQRLRGDPQPLRLGECVERS